MHKSDGNTKVASRPLEYLNSVFLNFRRLGFTENLKTHQKNHKGRMP